MKCGTQVKSWISLQLKDKYSHIYLFSSEMYLITLPQIDPVVLTFVEMF